MKYSEHIHLQATTLSWMAKCPLARNIVLSTGGSLSYTTPLTVNKLESKHNEFLELFEKAMRSALSKVKIGWFEIDAENLCFTISAKGKCYSICGRPDLSYVLYGEQMGGGALALVGEVTLSPSIKHMVLGELAFYTISFYVHYGCCVAGFIANPKSVQLMMPKLGISNFVKHVFVRKIDYEKALEIAEREREKYPWMCSLCDLKHLCIIGREM